MSAAFFTASEQLLSATANGVYQGILLALVAGLALQLCKRTNAATRHAVWFGVLLLVAALIPAHLFLACQPRPEIAAIATKPALNSVAPAPLDVGNTYDLAILDTTTLLAQPGQSDVLGTEGAPMVERAGDEVTAKDQGESAPAKQRWSRIGRSILQPSFWNREASFNLPPWICLGLVSAWIVLAGTHGGLMLGRITQVRRAKMTSIVPSLGLQSLFAKLRDALAAKRHVQLRISDAHHTAVLLGFAHPVVLLPSEMDADGNEGEVELVLRHELAHVVRRDDWYNLAQQVVQCALFFNPAVWWICSKLSLEREIACDDCVLDGNRRPRAYALALANAAGRIHHRRHLLAPGVSNNNSQLQQRITMILNTHRDRSPRLARRRLGYFTTAAALLAALAISAGPRLVLAQPQAPAGPDTESGPRPKSSPATPDIDNDHNIAPIAPEAPEPPEPPEPPEAPEPPEPPETPEPPEAPTPAIASISVAAPMPEAISASRHDRKNMSVEERLDRIERILEDLQTRGVVRNHHRGDDASQNFDIQVHPALPGDMSMNFDFDMQLKHAAEQAKRAAEQVREAAEKSKRAVEQGQRAAEQAMKDMEKMKSKDFQRAQEAFRDAQLDGPARELDALRSARESLQAQIQELQRHIKRLEEAQNRLKDRARGDSDPSEDSGPKAKTIAPDKTF